MDTDAHIFYFWLCSVTCVLFIELNQFDIILNDQKYTSTKKDMNNEVL